MHCARSISPARSSRCASQSRVVMRPQARVCKLAGQRLKQRPLRASRRHLESFSPDSCWQVFNHELLILSLFFTCRRQSPCSIRLATRGRRCRPQQRLLQQVTHSSTSPDTTKKNSAGCARGRQGNLASVWRLWRGAAPLAAVTTEAPFEAQGLTIQL